MQKILIVGHLAGHYRSQLFLQKLLHKDMGSSEGFVLTMANPRFFSSNPSKHFALKVFKALLNRLFSILFFFELFLKTPFCDKIYFLAMNHRHFPKLLLANLIWRKPIISDMYISIYDANIDRNNFRGSLLKRILTLRFEWYYKLLDRLLIEKSQKVIYIGNLEFIKAAENVKAKLTKSNYIIIPPTSPPKRKASPHINSTFRICWWGIYSPFHGVENIIKAAAILQQAQTDFSLYLFGTPLHDHSTYENLSKRFGLSKHVFFHTDKTFGNKKLEEHLSCYCDLALGNFSQLGRAQRSMPTKIIDAFSMCLPVLTMETDVLKDSVDIERQLYTCSVEPKSIAQEIVRIINEPEERAARAEEGYKHYLSNFSVNAVQEKFIRLFQD